MPAQLNHTIVRCHDKHASATALSDLLGLPAPVPFARFLVVEAANGVSLDFADDEEGELQPQHYAFLVTDEEFDQVFARLTDQGLEYFADPAGTQAGSINHRDGGRGVYWRSADGHTLEILTRPYGSGR
ncbi:MAG TPA: VOC family protein [Acidimicrobiales bacterium]|nr:VOC family protein [Acidimicrobiales bacterium]